MTSHGSIASACFALVISGWIVTAAPLARAAEAPPGAASAEQRAREQAAVTAFGAGQFREALLLYAALYVEFDDPIYLRNIGRCHQMLRSPGPAIASFEEYLARVALTPTEREEVQGYVSEMELLRQAEAERARAAAPPPDPPLPPEPTPPPAAAPVTPAAVLAPPAARLGDAAAVNATAPRAAPAPIAPWRTVGKVLLVGAGVLALASGAVTYASWSRYDRARQDGCGLGRGCAGAADRVGTLNLAAGLLGAGAVLAGATGGVLVFVFPQQRLDEGPVAGISAALHTAF